MKKKWLEMYNKALEYYKKFGNLEIPLRYVTEDGIKLGFWIYNQKKAYEKRFLEKKNTLVPLTDEQVELLENIGMIWNFRKNYWMEMYNHAKNYYNEHKNLHVPFEYKTKDNKSLGRWIINQRYSYKSRFEKNNIKKKYPPLSDEQIKLLESIGMIWDLKNVVINLCWMEKYEKAKQYYEEHGNLRVVQNYTIDGFNLGIWIRNQRRAYKNRFLGKRNNTLPLSREQVELLESIGMVWDMEEYVFSTTSLTQSKKNKLEKRFLEFLSDYIKENKKEFENFEDVKNIEKQFIKTLGSKENHYSNFSK